MLTFRPQGKDGGYFRYRLAIRTILGTSGVGRFLPEGLGVESRPLK